MIRLIVIEQQNSMRSFLEASLQAKEYEIIYFENPKICSIMKVDSRCKKKFPCGDIFIINYSTNFVNGIELVEEQELKGCKFIPENKAVLLHNSNWIFDKNPESLGCAVFNMPVEARKLNDWLSECEERLKVAG